MRAPAIGVFDSGVGGLTVLNALRAKWPAENFVYLADTARLPYGTKSLHTIRQYLQQNLCFLQRYKLKAVVVACNTASTALLEQPLASDIPIFNVVEPGARKAVQVSTSQRIGVLATRATVHSEAYPRAIRQLQSQAEIFQAPCPLFVPLVEEGWIDDPVTNLIVYRYVNSLARHQIDTLILGCTHYPVLRTAIAKAAGSGVTLVDSSSGLIEDLSRQQVPLSNKGATGSLEVLVTDFSPRLEDTIRQLLGSSPVDAIETVDIQTERKDGGI